MSFQIITDSNADLSAEVRKGFSDFHYLNVPFFIDDVEGDPNISGHEFFEKMRAGAKVRTAQINPPTYIALYEKLIEEGHTQFLCIAFSSKLSGLYESAVHAGQYVMDKHPEVNIITVDTISASIGMGHLAKTAVELRDQGKSIEETRDWLETNKQRVSHWFTVDDLIYLKRGGRITASAAWFGTALNIKPVLHIDETGKLIPVEKKIGRNKALQRLIDHYKETAIDPENGICYIMQADVPDEAEALMKTLSAQTGAKNLVRTDLGPVIGTHAGPGTMALVFIASER